MYVTCLDMEGVLVPEIWIAFAEASGIPELKRTTRDEPDYDKLMNWRLGHSARARPRPQGDPGDHCHHRPTARCKGILGRAARLRTGYRDFRHLHTIRQAAHGEAWHAYAVLQ